MTKNPKQRVVCFGCDRYFALSKTGRIWGHWIGPKGKQRQCPGSGAHPRKPACDPTESHAHPADCASGETTTRWVKVCVDCLERGINAHCVLVRIERSPATEPCDWCARLITGVRLQRTTSVLATLSESVEAKARRLLEDCFDDPGERERAVDIVAQRLATMIRENL